MGGGVCRGDQPPGYSSGFGNPDLLLFLFPPQIFSQEYINLLLSMYFFVLGILALSHTIRSEGISRQPLKLLSQEPVQGLGWEHDLLCHSEPGVNPGYKIQGDLPLVSVLCVTWDGAQSLSGHGLLLRMYKALCGGS